MTFEERLRELVETLADRLRHEAAGHFQESMGDLHALLTAERTAAATEAARDARDMAEREAADRLEAAVADAVREARETAEREAADRLESTVADAARQARETAERETLNGLEAALADTARDTRATVEREAAERLAALVAEAEARSYDAGRDEGRKEGEEAGREAAKEEGWAAGKEEGRREGKAEGAEEAKEEGRRAQSAAIERLAAATRLVDESRSLSEILDALADAARREAGSAALFLVRGDELRSWRLSGFGRALDEAARFDIPMSDAGLLAQAIREGKAVLANSADEASVPGFVSLAPGRQMLAVPVRLSGDVVAVLYGDQGENVDPRPAWPAALEILVRHASRWLEAVTAFRAAKLISGSTSPADAASRSAEKENAGGDLDADADTGKDADKGEVASDSEHPEDAQAARRYARLLISEIKLYHESDVLAGRRERDLATRLGGEIARARALYEQRVAPQARRGADYFHAELVSTLANGDATLLGN